TARPSRGGRSPCRKRRSAARCAPPRRVLGPSVAIDGPPSCLATSDTGCTFAVGTGSEGIVGRRRMEEGMAGGVPLTRPERSSGGPMSDGRAARTGALALVADPQARLSAFYDRRATEAPSIAPEAALRFRKAAAAAELREGERVLDLGAKAGGLAEHLRAAGI